MINYSTLDDKEIDIMHEAVCNYTCWERSLKHIANTYQTNTIYKLLKIPGYNMNKGIPWLVAVWPILVEHMAKRDIYNMSLA